MGAETVSDFFAYFWNPFPPIEFPHPVLTGKYVPTHMVTCYAMFR